MSHTPRSYHSPLREQDAQRTQELILSSARELFVTQGYSRVTMSDIAAAAGIAVKTVYASVGTKAAVLEFLLAFDPAHARLAEVDGRVTKAAGLEPAIALTAGSARADNERLRPSIDLLYASMASDEGARQAWNSVVAGCRQALRAIAGRLVEHRLVSAHLDVGAVDDRLWFCFGPAAWRTLITECHWSYEDAERFLRRQAVAMLTEPPDQRA
ncbi:helix-turn-helix domain-containing protein [Actinoplanes sp. NPDC089786]|uniref:TetR/AcrR family transcriptional regulator n=1 Tax=Actinoplanes sp. NPDC089786 TaxID=3155185 RepID=UPI003429C378